MSKYRWLRIRLPRSYVTKDGIEAITVSAIRSDGQPFFAWEPVDSYTEEKLRKNLDSCINDPALSFVANASAEQRKRNINMFKGNESWVEEPEP